MRYLSPFTMPSNRKHQGRASHNKRSNRRTQPRASSSLTARGVTTKTWNVAMNPMPSFNNTLKKDNSIHNFIQTIDLGQILTTSNTLPTFFARFFSFNDLQQTSSFQALFDQYHIKEIELWVQPVNNTATIATAGPTWYSVIDYDDAATPSALASLQQYTNVITTPLNNGHYIRFKPHVAEALYGGAFTAFGNVPSPWIDSASPGVQHYGFKMGCNVTATTVNFNMIMRYHFSTRNVF